MKTIKVGLISFITSFTMLGFFYWPQIHRSYFAAPVNAQSVAEIAEASAALNQPVDEPEEEALTGVPTHISLNDVGIVLPVKEGGIVNNDWLLSWDAVHYDKNGPLINNQSGGTLIYGHNISGVLGKTTGLELGDILVVRTDNNIAFIYELTGSIDANPYDVGAIASEGEPRVLLLTCSGSFNQTRRIMEFSLTGAREI